MRRSPSSRRGRCTTAGSTWWSTAWWQVCLHLYKSWINLFWIQDSASWQYFTLCISHSGEQYVAHANKWRLVITWILETARDEAATRWLWRHQETSSAVRPPPDYDPDGALYRFITEDVAHYCCLSDIQFCSLYPRARVNIMRVNNDEWVQLSRVSSIPASRLPRRALYLGWMSGSPVSRSAHVCRWEDERGPVAGPWWAQASSCVSVNSHGDITMLTWSTQSEDIRSVDG